LQKYIPTFPNAVALPAGCAGEAGQVIASEAQVHSTTLFCNIQQKMSQTKDTIARFVEFLSLPCRRRFPHEEFLPFIKKLAETIDVLRSECTSVDVGILTSLLKSLCAFESRVAGTDGIELRKACYGP
jgi:hypothetical protein